VVEVLVVVGVEVVVLVVVYGHSGRQPRQYVCLHATGQPPAQVLQKARKHWPIVDVVPEVPLLVEVVVVVVLVLVVVVAVVSVVVVVVAAGHSGRQALQNHCWHAGYQPPA